MEGVLWSLVHFFDIVYGYPSQQQYAEAGNYFASNDFNLHEFELIIIKRFFSSQNKLTTRMTRKKIFHNLILLHRDTQEYWLNQKFDWLFLSRLEIYVQSSQNILFQHFISSIKPTLLFHIEGTVERWENRSPICPICQQIKSLNLKWVFSVAILSKQTT